MPIRSRRLYPMFLAHARHSMWRSCPSLSVSNCTATNIILCAGDVCNDQTTSYLEVQTSQIITIYQGSNCVWTFTNAYSETLQVTLSGFYQFYPRFITEDSSTSTWSWGDVVPFKLPLPDVSQYVGDLTDEQI